MYRVALCDDEITCLETNHEMLCSILDELRVPYTVERYLRSESLLEALRAEPERYHLLLLDIRFDQMDGLTMARELRKSGIESSIIFITAYDQYVFEGYEVSAIQYLLKPVKREAMMKAVSYDLQRNGVRDELLFFTNRELHSVRRSELVYAESRYHYVILHLTGGREVEFYGGLDDVAEQLPPGEFRRCHKSVLVSLRYVTDLSYRKAFLSTGESVPVSRAYYKDFRSSVIWYC